MKNQLQHVFLPPGGSQFQRFGPSSEFRIFCFWPNREILICQCFMIFLAVSEGFRGFPKVPEGPRRSSKVPEGFQRFSKFPNCFGPKCQLLGPRGVPRGPKGVPRGPQGVPKGPQGVPGSPKGVRRYFVTKTGKLAEAFDKF